MRTGPGRAPPRGGAAGRQRREDAAPVGVRGPADRRFRRVRGTRPGAWDQGAAYGLVIDGTAGAEGEPGAIAGRPADL
ncbi:hypothetical protein [Streptomyces sp. NPDC002685]|uniref:hypothetical protein n=1 Tax=Streptomyces sp. NPDC002685 TaxID=3154540 RepID=UPI0033320EE4